MHKTMKPKKPSMVDALRGTTNGKPKKKGGYAG
jgi:hypothetical protein